MGVLGQAVLVRGGAPGEVNVVALGDACGQGAGTAVDMGTVECEGRAVDVEAG